MKKRKNSKYQGLGKFIENGVCFVCTANMCRSAMAEAIAKSIEPSINFTSCGLRTLNGYPATKEAKLAMAKRGISLESHTSKLVSNKFIKGKLIICMTEEQKNGLMKDFPLSKIFLLTEIGTGSGQDILDPIGKSLDKYIETASFLEYEIISLLSNIKI